MRERRDAKTILDIITNHWRADSRSIDSRAVRGGMSEKRSDERLAGVLPRLTRCSGAESERRGSGSGQLAMRSYEHLQLSVAFAVKLKANISLSTPRRWVAFLPGVYIQNSIAPSGDESVH